MTEETKQQPTLGYITELYDYITNHWAGQTSLDNDLQSQIFGEHVVPVPDTKNRKRYRRLTPEKMLSNEAGRVVEQLCALYPYPSTIGVQYTGAGRKSPSRADKVEIGLNEIIDQLNPPLDSPLERDRFNMIAYGRTTRFMAYGGHYWNDFPELTGSLDDWNERYAEWQRMGPIPIIWRDLSPMSTFPASYSRVKEELLTWQEVSAFELIDMFGRDELSGLGIDDKLPFGSQDFTLGIFANRDWLTYCLLSSVGGGSGGVGGIIRTVEHGLGTPPIRLIPGPTSSRKEVGKYWLSQLFYVKEMLKQIDRRLSEAATASKFDALPWMKATLQDASEYQQGSASNDMDFLEGDVTPLKASLEGQGAEDIGPVFQPQFGEKTLALAQWALARSERITGAVEALEGTYGPPGQPAWARAYAVEQAAKTKARLTSSIVASDLDCADMIIRCLGVHGEKVTLRPGSDTRKPGPEIIIDPEELADYKPVLGAKFKLSLPQNRRADYDLAISMQERVINGNLIGPSPDRILEEFTDIEQPMEEFTRTMTWRFLTGPQMQTYMNAQLLKDADAEIGTGKAVEPEELMRLAQQGRIPIELAQEFIALARGVNGAAPDRNRHIAPETVGALHAGAPLESGPGGPNPEVSAEGGY